MKNYKPLEIKRQEVFGVGWALMAMRLPKNSENDSTRTFSDTIEIGPKDGKLAKNLIRAGNDHAKAMRGIVVWVELEMQVGFMIELETYRHGVECLSTSSSMHGELKELSGYVLAEQKQADLSDKVYKRAMTVSYQALRSMYRARKKHRMPCWRIFCKWIEELPHFTTLIYPEWDGKGVELYKEQ